MLRASESLPRLIADSRSGEILYAHLACFGLPQSAHLIYNPCITPHSSHFIFHYPNITSICPLYTHGRLRHKALLACLPGLFVMLFMGVRALSSTLPGPCESPWTLMSTRPEHTATSGSLKLRVLETWKLSHYNPHITLTKCP